ncbi:MAG: HNH endonuclease [Chloroflexi bacterium]|nr:MAG: HNH endonuclease [Chloroflexota bacterium]
MAYISRQLRQKVTADAQNRCGYCLTAQQISGGQMHIEHILPLARGGVSDESNLWLSCAWCNSFKGAQTHAVDPLTGIEVPLFHPRTQSWLDHFRWSSDGAEIIGVSATGRATVHALQMNNEYILPARRQWIVAGWHPPTT